MGTDSGLRTTRPLKVGAPSNGSPLARQRPKQRDYSRSASRRLRLPGRESDSSRVHGRSASQWMRCLLDLETDYEIQEAFSASSRSQLKHVRAFFAMDRALAVTTDRVRHYILNRQKEGAAPATINREVEALQAGFNLHSQGRPAKMTYSPPVPEPCGEQCTARVLRARRV